MATSPTTIKINAAYHYPADLIPLVVDALAALCKSKSSLLLYFRGAGTPSGMLEDIEMQLRVDSSSMNKFLIARTVIQRLNEAGEQTIRVRRELLKRIAQTESYHNSWESDQAKAHGYVAQIRDVINVKDSFTRINNEREAASAAHRREAEAQQHFSNKRRIKLEAIKKDLSAQFSEQDPSKRGKALEGILNRFFEAYGILVRQSFTVPLTEDGRIAEQIDGVIELKGHIYLVEVKWLKDKVGTDDVSQHIVRVMARDGARGLMISTSGYTDAAVQTFRQFLSKRTFVLCDLLECVLALENEIDFPQILDKKINAAILDRRPYELAN